MSASPPASGSEFTSVLFEHPTDVDSLAEPEFFGDLNLDQVVEAVTAGRHEYKLTPYFYAPLHRVDEVHYRHEVLRDLESHDVLDAIIRFSEQMQTVRKHLALVEKLHYALQRQSWLVEAIATYCDAVRSLAGELGERPLSSRALLALRAHLDTYCAGDAFTRMGQEAADLQAQFAEIRYAVRIVGPRVTVTKYGGEPDHSVQVEQTFARFRQRDAADHSSKFTDSTEMNHVEANVLDGVARLYPDLYGRRTRFCARHGDFRDATVRRFDREIQFYLAYLELVGELRATGLEFCYPHVSARSKEIAARDTFDLALANKVTAQHGAVVCNDFQLSGPERVFVVSGPNNGGKTTFARTFGQLPYLASLGLLVPGREASLFLPDRIFTHFEREEDIETLRSKFEDELVRVHAIVEEATPRSVIVMNESFNSTSLSDALLVGTEVMQHILERDCLGVYVTFVDEIASLSEATVSLVSQVVPDDPAQRTFKLIRKAADGRAYAWALAQKYGLTYERLMDRIGS